MLAQKKTTTKPPWDADPWRVKEVKGSQITVTRGNKERRHAKNLVKVVKPHTRVHFVKEKTRRRMEEPECLSLDQIKTADKRYNMQQHQHQAIPDGPGAGGVRQAASFHLLQPPPPGGDQGEGVVQRPDHQGPGKEDNEDGRGLILIMTTKSNSTRS